MKKHVILLAGGHGRRMKMEQAKQFIEIGGLPILMHSFKPFFSVDNDIAFILVLPTHMISEWENLCDKNKFIIPHQIAAAGPERFHSVKSGLTLVPENTLVAIHDGVRPFVSEDVIKDCYTTAERKGNAIPTISISQSVRFVDGSLNKAIERNKLRLVQTPQVFRSSVIKAAYGQVFSEEFTDDASVLEKYGAQIHLVDGNKENIKITTTEDLLFAESLFQRG